MLDVNSEIAFHCKRVDGERCRVRKIEAKAARSIFSRQSRFSVLLVGKFQTGRGLLKVAAKEFTKQAPRRDESIAVIPEMKTICARLFVRRKRRLQRG